MSVRFGAAFHAFVSVLLMGTMWRVLAYHAMASNSPQVQHIGAAMTTQY